MSFNFSQFISWRTIQYRSPSHFVPEWDWFGRKNIAFFCCFQIDFSGWTQSPSHGSHRTFGYKSPCTFVRTQCLVRTPFHGYSRTVRRTFSFIPNLRIFHFVTFRVVLFCVLCYGSPVLSSNLTSWSSDTKFPGHEDALDDSTVELPVRLIDKKNFSLVLIWRRLFLHNRLPAASWPWCRAALRAEQADIQQTWNQHRKCFHSSRVKCPVVKMSASWFLDSTYLTWILGSKWILSNNQSSATLRILETCLSVGLLPLMIILTTASMSSKMCKVAPLWEEFTFEETK